MYSGGYHYYINSSEILVRNADNPCWYSWRINQDQVLSLSLKVKETSGVLQKHLFATELLSRDAGQIFLLLLLISFVLIGYRNSTCVQFRISVGIQSWWRTSWNCSDGRRSYTARKRHNTHMRTLTPPLTSAGGHVIFKRR